ncbi:MAG: Lrp/AsnC family transcriptional regulator [Nitriliruptoraceae bacterium]|nr:Lrp/AsnC family transcriptional regulator [Nitriliruptoraceae bacterium]
MAFTPDEVDLALLRALRADGRRSITGLADELDLSRSAVHTRLDVLRDAGALLGFAPVVDPARLGAGVTAFVLLSAGPGARLETEPLRAQLLGLPHVEYAALVTGEADVLLLVRAADLAQLRTFLLEDLRTVSGLRGTLTLLVLDEVIDRPFLLPGE